MTLDRSILRQRAKAIYKVQARNVPKRQRIPFSVFYKRWLEAQQSNVETPPQEDFDFSEMINELSED